MSNADKVVLQSLFGRQIQGFPPSFYHQLVPSLSYPWLSFWSPFPTNIFALGSLSPVLTLIPNHFSTQPQFPFIWWCPSSSPSAMTSCPLPLQLLPSSVHTYSPADVLTCCFLASPIPHLPPFLSSALIWPQHFHPSHQLIFSHTGLQVPHALRCQCFPEKIFSDYIKNTKHYLYTTSVAIFLCLALCIKLCPKTNNQPGRFQPKWLKFSKIIKAIRVKL